MTSPDDADPIQQPAPLAPIPPLYVSKIRPPTTDESPETSSTSLPIRTSSPALSTRPSTLASTLIRSESPSGRRSLSLSRLGRSSTASPLVHTTEYDDDTRSLIVRAFAPTVGIYASEDTDELARSKGTKNGFAELVRPFGERVVGKVVVRDITGASRGWDDFGVHFADLGQLCNQAVKPPNDSLEELEEILERHLEPFRTDVNQESIEERPTLNLSPQYRLFLSRILSLSQLSPHQSFRHPTACVIAISSHTPNPIETLRQLYAQTAHGNRSLPMYVNPEYLRYYVLVHDEDRSDFSKTSALFDQMKRHFGLHCHLLRLRSSHCSFEDDDAVELPICEWLSPSEDIAHVAETNNLVDLGSPTQPFIFDSDIQAIRSFVRELVAQSVIPHMENRIALWNEQVASRRRGISGRLATFSRRWGGFGSGSTSRNASSSVLGGGSSGSGQSGNYEPVQGIYRYDTSEAQLQKLADYAVMLRDFKLAISTYDLVRTDFNNDKAWKYLASANEMSVIAGLLNPLAAASGKALRIAEYEGMLETAGYSYLTRCNDPASAVRALLISVELLKVRGRAASEIAARWVMRCLEWNVLGENSKVLVGERVMSCLGAMGSSAGDGRSWGWGSRKRKAGMWSVVAAEDWMKLGQVGFASSRLEDADRFYEQAYTNRAWRLATLQDGWHQFTEMQNFIHQLQTTARVKRGQMRRRGRSDAQLVQMDESEASEQESQDQRNSHLVPEQLEHLDTRQHRRSIIGDVNPLSHPLDPATVPVPLSPIRSNRSDALLMSSPRREENDDFE